MRLLRCGDTIFQTQPSYLVYQCVFFHQSLANLVQTRNILLFNLQLPLLLRWSTEFGLLNRGDMLNSEQHWFTNEKKKF